MGEQDKEVNSIVDRLADRAVSRQEQGKPPLYGGTPPATVEKGFREHRPSYFTGFESKHYTVTSFDQVLALPFVKNFAAGDPHFWGYALSTSSHNEPGDALMALYGWSEEFNGCLKWLVVGYLSGFTQAETKLKRYQDLIAGHKPNCWMRKYAANKDLLGFDRPFESIMKILEELGWKRDDEFGIACYCDCGYVRHERS